MATLGNETMTELEAHRDFSAVLASFVISWGFHAQDKEARASGMDAQSRASAHFYDDLANFAALRPSA